MHPERNETTMEDFLRMMKGKSLIAASNPREYVKDLIVLRERELKKLAEARVSEFNNG